MPADENGSPLAARLDALFRRSRPGGRRWTNDDVAAELKRLNPDLKVSGAYLSALRTGKRTRPSPELQVALAEFFGVAPAYFFDPEHADQVDHQLHLLDQMRNSGVRALALRAAGLPDETLEPIRAMLDEVRKLQGLPPIQE